jgi:hypothetical protein
LCDPRNYVYRDIEPSASILESFFGYGTETLGSTYKKNRKTIEHWLSKKPLGKNREDGLEKHERADSSERDWWSQVVE